MTDCIYNTDPDWIKSISDLPKDHEINFWRQDQRILHLKEGDHFYFKLRGTHYIVGRASFVSNILMTIDDAWIRFGKYNGVESLQQFRERTVEIFDLPIDYSGLIGCVILDNFKLLPDHKKFLISDEIYPGSIMGPKYYPNNSIPGLNEAFESINNITPTVSEPRSEVSYDNSHNYDDFPDISVSDINFPSDFNEPESNTSRSLVTTTRVIRDTVLTLKLKALYNYKCQLCDTIIKSENNKRYAECHHIKPLGEPHLGIDRSDNIICVCPNCHAKLDYGFIKLDKRKMMTDIRHNINDEFIKYHNEYIYIK